MTYDVAIIGGGISGLTAAYDLHRNGRKVVVLERQQQVGGNAISERIDGFLMEHGPTTLNAMVPQALNLASKLGLSGQQLDLGKGIRQRYLRQGSKLHGISINPAGFLLSSYLSPLGRLSLLGEILRPCKTAPEDESVHAFASRRFGREFADKVMDPLAAGMFGGDSQCLSMHATFPTLVEMEQRHGSITRGVIKAKRGSEPAKRLFSFRDGVGSLPHALSVKLGNAVQTGIAVKSFCHVGEGYKIDTHSRGSVLAKSVVLAVQPHVATQLLAPLDEQSANAASLIDAPPMSVIFLAYRRDQIAHPLDSLGFLSVKDSGGIITGAQFLSTMFDGRAPDGFVSIAAYVGGVRNRDAAGMASDNLIGQVHRELSLLMQIKGEPVLSRCRQWARSLPQYEMGHSDKVAVLKSLSDRHPGLYLTGNYLAGVSVANCIGQARAVAGDVENHLALSAGLELSKVSAG